MAETVLGRYELLRLLGRGGMADVYVARRRVAGLEKRLVIKRVRPQKVGDTTFMDLFVREARLSMTLNHQNIVPVFDFGRVGDAAFLAMEFVEGRDLGATLRKGGGPVPPLLAAFIAAECCQALEHAHKRLGPDGAPLGVVHRDVTPRNVLLSWAGEVKLTDFGVAALAGDPSGDVRGTIAYMAPEQARYEPTDARADLYSLGLVLWEMIAGERVRKVKDRVALLESTRLGVLPPLPEGPPALLEVIAKATQQAPGERYADAAEMHAALDRYLVEARAAAPGPTPARQLSDWLEAVWGDEAGRIEGEPLDGASTPPPDDLDPATMRSLAETAGDLPASMATPAPGSEAASVAAAAVAASAAALAPARGATGAATAIATTPRRRHLPAAIMVALAAIVAVVYLATTRDGSHGRTSVVSDAATATEIDAAPVIDAASTIETDAGEEADAAVDAPASVPVPGSDAGSRRPTIDAGADPRDAAPSAQNLRKVTIGATPWADFTVDDDPTPHQTPETIALPPGPHRIHFSNARLGVTRTVTIDVPPDRDIKHVEPLE